MNRLRPSIFLFLACLPASVHAAATPIEHLIVIVGENRTFDNLFATYTPKGGQRISNLLSKGIVKLDGSPGKNFGLAAQQQAVDNDLYSVEPNRVGPYATLPQPYTTGAFGQALYSPDPRFPQDLPNGPFQITKYVYYGAHTGDPAHRFFQMWQQVDGGKMDLFTWVGTSIGFGSSNGPHSGSPGMTAQGGVSMGFYNMAMGDAPILRNLAEHYAIGDNYHQPIMGGTGPNYFALATGDVAYYSREGKPERPPEKQVENPDPRPGTNNWYRNDGYAGGSYVDCSDENQPGVAGIADYLKKLPYKAFNGGNCAPNTYYLVNNYEPGYSASGEPAALGPDHFTVPPLAVPNIGEALSAGKVSWKWYAGGRGDGKSTVNKEYCTICDPFTFSSRVMTTQLRDNLQDLSRFYSDVGKDLPAVSFISPYDSISGHPGYAMEPGFDQFVEDIIEKVRQNRKLWEKTAILITYDEGGGYYDSGYIQTLDFFGDGTRIPVIAVSPYAKKGFVDHTYYDHVSILKFIEKNWGLPPLSSRSRDNLPNPVQKDSYIPLNRPAIGDLMNLFEFGK
ncbi:MAG: alkaline phosphatase family protein [Burkholderiales bacterium]|nr:alkaline phosphatase family protein [Burkholderiales bacterium]